MVGKNKLYKNIIYSYFLFYSNSSTLIMEQV